MLLASIRANGPVASARFLVLHFRELGVDHVAVVLLAGLGLRPVRAAALRAGLRLPLLLGVDLLAQLLRGLRQRLGLRLDVAIVLGLEDALRVLDRRLDFLLLGGVDLVAVLLERLPHGVYQRFGGMPRGEGGMSVRLNWPSDLLPDAISRSPCSTWMVTAVWLSSAVENTCCALVGMVVFLLMSLVITPPSVSMPSDSGVTSRSSTSFTSPFSTPAWIAAPIATASSGFTSLRGSLPKSSRTVSITFGMRVWPPTRITSSISDILTPASLMAMRQGSTVFWMRSSTRDSNFARVIFIVRCFGPFWSAVM